MKYYLHNSNSFQDEKITKLYIKYGYEGLGLFYTLLEKLAIQEKPIDDEVLKKQLNIGKRLERVWNFMQEIELISSKNGETFNENLLNFSEKYQINKEKTRKKVADWRERQIDGKNVTDNVPVSNDSKLKEIKIKENKFRECLKPFLKKYSKKILDGFFNHWTESDISGKLRWEMQDMFNIDKRLTKWALNEFGETEEKPTYKRREQPDDPWNKK